MDRYAVIGNPIAHSKSPAIHAAFATQTGERLEYGRILGDPATFEIQARTFLSGPGRGLNVTVPFKERACALADERSVRAEAAGAANTLIRLPDDRIRADNTDGVGLVRDLRDNHGVDIAGRRVLVLGAGGAARGILGPLLAEAPERLVVANRTAAKALELAARLGGAVEGMGLEGLEGRRFDLILNATAAGLAGEVPRLPADCLVSGGVVYDLMYGDRSTAFVRWGLEHGAGQALDGLGMLVEQAAESFFLWRGVRPRTAPVTALLRSARKRPAQGPGEGEGE